MKKIFISWISPCEDDMVKGGKWWKKKIGFRDSSLETTEKWGEEMRENLFQSTPTTAKPKSLIA